MTAAYQDNFGFWDIDGPEECAFFEFIKGQSAYVTYERWQRRVGLMPSKTLRASCVCAVECGAPLSISGYDREQSTILDPPRPAQRAVRPRVWQLRPRPGHRRNERMAAKGVRWANLRIVASDPDLAAIERTVGAEQRLKR